MPPMSAVNDSQLDGWEEVEAEVAAVADATARSGTNVNPDLESDAETLRFLTPPQKKLRRTSQLSAKDIAESGTPPARSSSETEATMIVPPLGACRIPSEEAQLLSPTPSLFDWDGLDSNAKLRLLREQARIKPPWWSE